MSNWEEEKQSECEQKRVMAVAIKDGMKKQTPKNNQTAEEHTTLGAGTDRDRDG